MSVEFGHFLLIEAAFLSLFTVGVGLFGIYKKWPLWFDMAAMGAILQFLATLASFAILVRAFVGSDFSLRIVAENSHTLKPFFYKISGVWGNHEGSMFLWILILSLFGALVALYTRTIPPLFRTRVLIVQSAIGFLFYLFILLTSNPFWRLAPPPENGKGLNPLLQDPGLALHPPFLYLGYVGLSVSFSFAIAALWEGRVDANWARFVRPWALASWIFLTIGIGLGSWWAYYELGWGGFWFWDPVENVSLMPWLVSLALLHSALVVEKRNALRSWTILLAIIAFSLSLIGTFVVRSGILSSVHSFSSDPGRGIFILFIIGITLVLGFGLYGLRAPKLVSRTGFAPFSRETGMVLNNLLLTTATAVVFIGTLWPLIVEVIFGETLAVGAPFYNQSFTPFMVLLALWLPIGGRLPWKRAHIGALSRDFWILFFVSTLLMLGAFLLQQSPALLAPLSVFLASWVIFGSLQEFFARITNQDKKITFSLVRLIRRADYAKWLAHIGFGLLILAIGVLSAHTFENIRATTPNTQFEAGPFTIKFEGIKSAQGPNYFYDRGQFVITRGAYQKTLYPETRQYPVESMPTTEAAITPYWLGDLYLVMRPNAQDPNLWSVYFYYKPLANLLWIAAAFMAIGGILSLIDRKIRYAPRTNSRQAKVH